MARTKTNKNHTVNVVSRKKQNIFDVSTLYVNAKSAGYNVIIPHVCNNVDLFGAGFAQDVAKKYPEVKNNYHMLGKRFLQSHPGYVQFIDVEYEPRYSRSLVIANMIAQNGIRSKENPRPLNYAYLVKSMIEVKKYCLSKFGNEDTVMINCPKFGSGLAGGNWDFINCLIEDIWSDLRVTVYA